MNEQSHGQTAQKPAVIYELLIKGVPMPAEAIFADSPSPSYLVLRYLNQPPIVYDLWRTETYGFVQLAGMRGEDARQELTSEYVLPVNGLKWPITSASFRVSAGHTYECALAYGEGGNSIDRFAVPEMIPRAPLFAPNARLLTYSHRGVHLGIAGRDGKKKGHSSIYHLGSWTGAEDEVNWTVGPGAVSAICFDRRNDNLITLQNFNELVLVPADGEEADSLVLDRDANGDHAGTDNLVAMAAAESCDLVVLGGTEGGYVIADLDDGSFGWGESGVGLVSKVCFAPGDRQFIMLGENGVEVFDIVPATKKTSPGARLHRQILLSDGSGGPILGVHQFANVLCIVRCE